MAPSVEGPMRKTVSSSKPAPTMVTRTASPTAASLGLMAVMTSSP